MVNGEVSDLGGHVRGLCGVRHQKRKQKHEEGRPLFPRRPFYHSHLVSSPVAKSRHFHVKDLCLGLYYYIFLHVFLFFTSVFSTFVYHKNTTLEQMLQRHKSPS